MLEAINAAGVMTIPEKRIPIRSMEKKVKSKDGEEKIEIQSGRPDGGFGTPGGDVVECDLTFTQCDSKSYVEDTAAKGLNASAILKSNQKIIKHKELVNRAGRQFMPLVLNEYGQIINDTNSHFRTLCEYVHDVAPHVYPTSRALYHYLQHQFYLVAEKRTFAMLASAKRCSHDNRGKDMAYKRKRKKKK